MVAPAIIAAGAMLAGGLLQAQANKEEAEKQRRFQAEQQGFQAQREALASMTAGQQQAFRDLMEGHRAALIR